jgi:uncharacterized protein DUF932
MNILTQTRLSRNDLVVRSKPNESLSLDEMRARFPTIFAQSPHESRSDRYVFLSTERMVRRLVEREFVPVEVRLANSRDPSRLGFQKHSIRFRHLSDLGGGGERRIGDTSFEVLLRNAHDGTSSYQFMAGLLRLICLNGMVVSDGTVGSVRLLHTGSRAKQLAEVERGAHIVLAQGPRVIEKVREWKTIQLTPSERDAFAESARTIRFGDSKGKVETPIEARQLLIARRPDDVGNDLWKTFNVVQENATRGGLSAIGRNARRTTTREVAGIDGDIKLNKALWSLAEKMAELKRAA